MHLDRRARVSSYLFFGLVGAVLGSLVAIALGSWTAMPESLVLVAIVAPLASFLVALKVAQILAGRERIVLYEMLLASVAGSALVLWLAELPVRPGLDLVTIGCGVFLVFGRIGCLFAGCCHGRPNSWGIAYGEAHARAGFARYYIGIRLFPIQLVESLAHGCLTAVAALILLSGNPAGIVALFYFLAYAVVRFALELARGDDDRSYALGLSEAQWLAVVTVWICVGLATRWTPAHANGFAAVATVLSLAALCLIGLTPRLAHSRWGLRHARRVSELARALGRLTAPPASPQSPGVQTTETAAGLRISLSLQGGAHHYGLSSANRPLDVRSARIVAQQIAMLQHDGGDFELTEGQRGQMFLASFPARCDIVQSA